MRSAERRRAIWSTALATTAALALPATAAAHARLSPPVSLAGELQLYSLAVPTEKAGLTTSTIVMSVPSGFSIDSFAPPPPGWTMHANPALTRVTWTGGRTPAGEDSLFQFLAQPAAAGKYTFQVQQTYSDGSIVNWAGPEGTADPAPSIEAVSSIGGGGTSTLTVVALIVGALGLLAGGYAIVSGAGRGGHDGRPLA